MTLYQPIAVNSELHHTMQQWRRDIHQHPETAYEEFRTSAKVAQQLKALGLEIHEQMGGTGWSQCFRAHKEQGDILVCVPIWMLCL